MRFRTGLFLGFLLVVALGAHFVFQVFVDEIKPSARQAMEDSLLDTAHLLAALAKDELKLGTLPSGRLAQDIKAYQTRDLNAQIWGFERKKAGLNVLVTDAKGIVLYDSTGESVGRDFSKWNDIYLTLRGRYGARSSPSRADSESTTMHVAAPILDDGTIIGVMSVSKSNEFVQPFILRTQKKIMVAGTWLLAISIFIGLIVSFWLSRSIDKLLSFSTSVSEGERTSLPRLGIRELNALGMSLQKMRERLEGKRYVEEYVWTLTHEMKSPLTAIHASAELLEEEDMPRDLRASFLKSIRDQSRRLHGLVEKMLQQAQVEQKVNLEAPEELNLRALAQDGGDSLASRLTLKNLSFTISGEGAVRGDRFLLSQALTNLLENALDFSPPGGSIQLNIETSDHHVSMEWIDEGPGIPAFAKEKIFDRFFSLPRPDTGARSTGLGLTFVREVIELHQGTIEIHDHVPSGTRVRLFFQK